jgi:hypothetical protein
LNKSIEQIFCRVAMADYSFVVAVSGPERSVIARRRAEKEQADTPFVCE